MPSQIISSRVITRALIGSFWIALFMAVLAVVPVLGAGIVWAPAAVILIFLRNLTSTLIISVSIPLSILVTFIVLYFTGQTLNVFTLGGLALGIGRLVDDSIVELENIQRHLNTTPRRWDAILEAAREVAMPIFHAARPSPRDRTLAE